jgi:hypothetical protein
MGTKIWWTLGRMGFGFSAWASLVKFTKSISGWERLSSYVEFVVGDGMRFHLAWCVEWEVHVNDLFSDMFSIAEDVDPSVASYMHCFVSVYFERRGQALESLFHLKIPGLGVEVIGFLVWVAWF